jgi:hypothetical protein
MQRVQEMLKPYTMEDFINDANPVDHKDVQRLEKVWLDYQNRRFFNTCY